MADHPAIVALRDLLILHSDDSKLHQARAAYAAVIRDLMEPSEAMKTAWSTCPSRAPQSRHEAMLRARAREIGVEV